MVENNEHEKNLNKGNYWRIKREQGASEDIVGRMRFH
jgi:hypothetical protein